MISIKKVCSKNSLSAQIPEKKHESIRYGQRIVFVEYLIGSINNSNFKMAEEHTTLNEVKLTQLIKKIFQEEFKKEEVRIKI